LNGWPDSPEQNGQIRPPSWPTLCRSIGQSSCHWTGRQNRQISSVGNLFNLQCLCSYLPSDQR